MEDVELERLLDKKNVLDKEFPKFFTPTVLLINGCECRERGGVPCWLFRSISHANSEFEMRCRARDGRVYGSVEVELYICYRCVVVISSSVWNMK